MSFEEKNNSSEEVVNIMNIFHINIKYNSLSPSRKKSVFTFISKYQYEKTNISEEY
jgi:hypothetical protein